MFGDFSRFSNDPELGLTGVYLSQGSPLLDSDWNEQVAGLTEWMTVLGRLACGDGVSEKLRGIGFSVTWQPDRNHVEVGPGMALLGGRVVQSQRVYRAHRQGPGELFRSPRLFSSDLNPAVSPAVPPSAAHLSLISRNLPAGMLWRSPTSWTSGAVCEVTDWAIWLSDDENMPKARTVGDGGFLVPRLKVESLPLPRWSGHCLVECHWADAAGHRTFKVARTSHNVLPLRRIEKLENKLRITVPAGDCRLLDLLDSSATTLKAEFEDDYTAHLRSIKTLRPDGDVIRLDDVAQLFEVTAKRESNGMSLTIETLQGAIDVDERFRPILRLWDVAGEHKDLKIEEVRAEQGGQYVIAGDRWYVPIEDGKPAAEEFGVPGHRVFRGVAKLAPDGTPLPLASSANSPPPLTGIAPSPAIAYSGIELPDLPETVSAPLARPFNASLYRLTTALNATRMLTRNTPCKELQTRVSFLPLRRWLASAYVHEIADLDLDTFLAKVQRSIDVPFEEESRFRDQAALVLEEARRIGGSLESETSSPDRWA